MLGLSFEAFTLLHVAISLVAIAAGLLLLPAFLRNQAPEGLTGLFLATTVLTSITGFLFPFHQWLPSHTFGVISLVALGAALAAFYHFKRGGRWRAIYIVSALLALYLNIFVLIVQGFLKVPALRALAPTQTELPFLLAQLALLAAFVLIGYRALKAARG